MHIIIVGEDYKTWKAFISGFFGIIGDKSVDV
jgi:hypothetical protein